MVSYLCSAPYAPGRELGVNPLDPEIGIEWPTTGRDGARTGADAVAKDAAAPSLAEAKDAGPPPVVRRGAGVPRCEGR